MMAERPDAEEHIRRGTDALRDPPSQYGPTQEPVRAFDVVRLFESRLAAFTGAPYAVAVDRCRNGLFLCCKYLHVGEVTIPARTYSAVPAYIKHAGGQVRFTDVPWSGVYRLAPYPIWDAAGRCQRDMFALLNDELAWLGMERPYLFACLSFHHKKPLAIGSGGAVLTDDPKAAAWLRMARHDGRRDKVVHGDERPTMLGWGMYMRPDDAARGLMLLDVLPDAPPDHVEDYPDLSTWDIFSHAV